MISKIKTPLTGHQCYFHLIPVVQSLCLVASGVSLFSNSLFGQDLHTAYSVTTFAGSGQAGAVDGPGTSAQFNFPEGITVDKNENVFVADRGNNKIRKINKFGDVSTYAGSGNAGFKDGIAAAADFNGPSGISVDLNGNVYVADSSNGKIRKIDTSCSVSTLGNPYDFQDTDWKRPISVSSVYGGVAFVKSNSNQIFWLSRDGSSYPYAGSGFVGRVDGSAGYASFNSPEGVVLDTLGNSYIADSGNHKIRKKTFEGNVSTISGSGHLGASDGPEKAASFRYPAGIAIDSYGNLYISDTGNSKVRMISTNGNASTIAGSGLSGDADGVGSAATFNWLRGIAVASSGNIYVADNGNHKIRKLTPVLIPKPAPTPLPPAPFVPENPIIYIEGGEIKPGMPMGWISGKVNNFFISKYEVAWSEWKRVREWAKLNDYDIEYYGDGVDDNYPVQSVNWYDAAKWCNAKSEMEGLPPVYWRNDEIYRSGEVEVGDRQFFDIDTKKTNGYRLPTVEEWQWAARGGLRSRGFTYSGSNDAATVTKIGPLGSNLENELGLSDFSGNVAEWSTTRNPGIEFFRVICSDPYVAGGWDPLENSSGIGFRIARSSPEPSPSPQAGPVQEGVSTGGSAPQVQNLQKGVKKGKYSSAKKSNGGSTKSSAKKSNGGSSKKSSASKSSSVKKSGSKKKFKK